MELRKARPYSADAELTLATQRNSNLELEGINCGSSTNTTTAPKTSINQIVNSAVHANTVVFDAFVRALKRDGEFNRSLNEQNSNHRSRNERRDYGRGEHDRNRDSFRDKNRNQYRDKSQTVIEVFAKTTAIVATMTVVTYHAVVMVKDTIPIIERAVAKNPFVSIPANAIIRAKEIAAMKMATEVHNALTLSTDATVTNEALKNDKTAANTQGIVMILAYIVNEPTMRTMIANVCFNRSKKELNRLLQLPSNQTSQPRLLRPKT